MVAAVGAEVGAADGAIDGAMDIIKSMMDKYKEVLGKDYVAEPEAEVWVEVDVLGLADPSQLPRQYGGTGPPLADWPERSGIPPVAGSDILSHCK